MENYTLELKGKEIAITELLGVSAMSKAMRLISAENMEEGERAFLTVDDGHMYHVIKRRAEEKHWLYPGFVFESYPKTERNLHHTR